MTKQDLNLEAGWLMSAPETTREVRSGLPGLGGRPSLHPAWSGSVHPGGAGLEGRVSLASADAVKIEERKLPRTS